MIFGAYRAKNYKVFFTSVALGDLCVFVVNFYYFFHLAFNFALSSWNSGMSRKDRSKP
jgi:hypothetical protein